MEKYFNKLLTNSLRKGILLLILSFLFFLNTQKSIFASEPTLSFSPDNISVNMGETFAVDVVVDTAGNNIGGVGAKILFDPNILNVENIEKGTIFSEYPAINSDNTEGTINISGIVSSATQLYRGKGIVAILTFSSEAEGSSYVEYVFEPNSTTDSNIAVMYGSGDILSRVEKLAVAIGDSPLPPPSSSSTTTTTQPSTTTTPNLNSALESFTDEGNIIAKTLTLMGIYENRKVQAEEGHITVVNTSNLILYIIIFILVISLIFVLYLLKRRSKI